MSAYHSMTILKHNSNAEGVWIFISEIEFYNWARRGDVVKYSYIFNVLIFSITYFAYVFIDKYFAYKTFIILKEHS